MHQDPHGSKPGRGGRSARKRLRPRLLAVITCGNCGTQAEEGARFCPACGSELATLCASCGTALPDGAAFCPTCGQAAVATGGTGHERRVVTIVFADVTGSTELGEQLDPERFRELITIYAQAMREEIEAEGGTVEKFIGDAVMAAFGVPTAHEDDPARALRAAHRMLARLAAENEGLRARFGVELQMRIGVNTGEVLAMIDAGPGDAMVAGDAVNAAARLEAAAEPGQVVVAERTASSVRGFRFEDLGALTVKGKARPIRAFALGDALEGAPQRGVPGLSAPMIGRDDELAIMRAVFERVVGESRPSTVTIYGDAGLGKSRLSAEFLSWAERTDSDPLVLRGRCLPYGDGITYWPLAEILKGHAGVLDSDPTDIAIEKVRKVGRELLSADISPDPARAAAALAYTVGLEDPEISFVGVDPKEVRAEVHEAWRLFFSALALDGPVIVVVEDIHWADPVLLDLLEELSSRAQGPILFVCPSRPELTSTRPGWGGGGRNASAVVLDPLVRSLLTVDDLPPSVHATILERAEGNPFYIEEIVRRLIDEGAVVRVGDRWRATEVAATIDIPDTVQGVLAARIDLLDADDKRVVQAAAVVGRAFWPGPVAELTGMSVASVLEHLRKAEDRELVRSKFGSSLAGQPEYLFKHILTRDVAYGSLPRRDRADAHRRVADWLQRSASERVSEFAELLAYHLGTAAHLATETGDLDDDLQRAATRWLRAASDAARRRLAIRKAVHLAEEALTLAGTDLERALALEALGEAQFAGYFGDEAFAAFVEAVRVRERGVPEDGRAIADVAGRAADFPIRWPGSMVNQRPTEDAVRALIDLGLANLPPGDSEERIRLLALQAGWPFAFPKEDYTEEEIRSYELAGVEAADIAERLGRWDLASGALDEAGAARASTGRYGPTVVLWERRRALMPRVTSLLEIGDCHAVGAWTFLELGQFDVAVEVAQEGLAAIVGRMPSTEVHTRSWMAAALHLLGRWDEALEQCAALDELLGDRREDELPYFATHGVGTAGLMEHARGDETSFRRRLETLSRTAASGSGRSYPSSIRLLTLAGEFDRSLAVQRPWNWRVHRTDALWAELERDAAAGRWTQGQALLLDVREQAAAGPAPILGPVADRFEARAASAVGDDDAAVPLFQRAIEGFVALRTPYERAQTEVALARALRAKGEIAQADDLLGAALATFDALGAVVDRARASA
jgi:class 3 adenylate cyclase/tetratricopeptide (TPR) repeat protein